MRGKKRSREMEIKSSRERENCSNPGSEKQKRDAARRAKSKNKEDFSSASGYAATIDDGAAAAVVKG